MKSKILIDAAIVATIFIPAAALAQDVETFHQLPMFADLGSGSTPTTIEGYVNSLFNLAISIAAILVVFRLIMAGVQYMFSEVITKKGQAKEDIKNALLGLLIILGAVTILNTVNPQISQTNFLRSASPAVLRPSPANTPPTHQQTGIDMYTEAAERANECGGQAVRQSDGNWTVTCPGPGPVGGPPQELTGWPQTFSNPGTDYLEAIAQCEGAGGSPEAETTDSFPPQTRLHCYQ